MLLSMYSVWIQLTLFWILLNGNCQDNLFVLQSSEAEGQLIESLQSKPTGGSVRELEVIHFSVRLRIHFLYLWDKGK